MNIHKHKSQSNNKTNNNNQLTPELNHHLIPSRNSRSLAQALPTKNKRWNSSSQKPAFTIIEVVLVLAIAGLIFLMVFIALPALQRNQRDTQRKNDMSRILSQLKAYQSNSRGQYISDFQSKASQYASFEANYLPIDEFKDPTTGERCKVILCNGDGTARCWEEPEIGEYMYNSNGKCDGEDYIDFKGNSTQYVIRTKLEGGGFYCIDM